MLYLCAPLNFGWRRNPASRGIAPPCLRPVRSRSCLRRRDPLPAPLSFLNTFFGRFFDSRRHLARENSSSVASDPARPFPSSRSWVSRIAVSRGAAAIRQPPEERVIPRPPPPRGHRFEQPRLPLSSRRSTWGLFGTDTVAWVLSSRPAWLGRSPTPFTDPSRALLIYLLGASCCPPEYSGPPGGPRSICWAASASVHRRTLSRSRSKRDRGPANRFLRRRLAPPLRIPGWSRRASHTLKGTVPGARASAPMWGTSAAPSYSLKTAAATVIESCE